MSVYEPLQYRLLSLKVSSVRMKFSDIEEIIGRDLPASARKYPALWANNDQGGKRHSMGWLHAGWRAEDLALEMEEVTFTRASLTVAPRAIYQAGIRTALSADWRLVGEIGLSPKAVLVFPDVPPAAGVYRFRFAGGDLHRCYIGESANLKSRFGYYRRPDSTQATNVRLNRLMLDHLISGGTIELDLTTELGGLQHKGADKGGKPGRQGGPAALRAGCNRR